jgi:hypothetical protein
MAFDIIPIIVEDQSNDRIKRRKRENIQYENNEFLHGLFKRPLDLPQKQKPLPGYSQKDYADIPIEGDLKRYL